MYIKYGIIEPISLIDINIFLRRQDPFGKNGLYAGDLYPNDVYGNPLAALDNYYEEVTETTC